MSNTDHLNALHIRLSNESERLRNARTPQERVMRTVWVDQIKKEIEAELAFLGMGKPELNLTDDELLAELVDK